MGNLAADEAGVAALGHDGDAMFGANADGGSHLGGRTRRQHQRRMALPAIAPLRQPGRDLGRIVGPAAVAEDGFQGGEGGRRSSCHAGLVSKSWTRRKGQATVVG